MLYLMESKVGAGGAFLLNWIWAIGNKTWIGLLALIPYVGFIVAIWLGFKGREMAWKNQQWESVEHFNRVQKKWSRWGLGLAVGAMLLGILAAIVVPAYSSYRQRAEEQKAAAEIGAAVVERASDIVIAPVPSSPMPQASGTFDSNDNNLPLTLDTVAGQLTKAQLPNGQSTITLNGATVFTGEDAQWQYPIHLFKQSDRKQFVLMASSGGRGNSCEALFFFLIIEQSGVTATPEFGSCATQGSYSQEGGKITVTIPKMGGHSVVVFDGVTLREDGNPVQLGADNDPSK